MTFETLIQNFSQIAQFIYDIFTSIFQNLSLYVSNIMMCVNVIPAFIQPYILAGMVIGTMACGSTNSMVRDTSSIISLRLSIQRRIPIRVSPSRKSR